MGVVANLVVKVSANLADLSKGLGTAESQFALAGKNLASKFGVPMAEIEGAFARLTKIAPGAGLAVAGVGTGIAVAAAAAVIAGKQLFDLSASAAAAGERLGDLTDKTGIAAPRMHQLSNAMIVAGGSGESLANAMFMLERRMSTNGDAVATGLQKIGLSFADLQHLDPAGQLLAIAGGFNSTVNPVARAGAVMDIFGRQGRELLPVMDQLTMAMTLTSGIETFTAEQVRLSEAFGMSIRTLKLEWEHLTLAMGMEVLPIAMAGMVALIVEVEKLREKLQMAAAIWHTLRGTSPDMPGLPGAPKGAAGPASTDLNNNPFELAQVYKDLDHQFEATQKRRKAADDASVQAAKDAAEAWAFVQNLQADVMRDTYAALQRGAAGQPDWIKEWIAADYFRQQEAGTVRLDSHALPGAGEILQTPGVGMEPFKREEEGGFFDSIKDSWEGLKAQLNPKAMGEHLGTGLIEGFGGMLSGGLTSLVNFGISKLVGLVKGWFGVSEEVQKVRDEQDKLIESFRALGATGTDFEVLSSSISDLFADLGRSGEEARLVLEGVMDTDNPERYAEALREVNAAMDEQKARWEGVQSAVGALNAFTAEGITNLGQYNIASQSAVAIFDAWVLKTGDVMGALQQIGPTLDALALSQATFGVAANDAALQQLLGLRAVTAENPVLMAQIQQSTLLLHAMGAAHLLNNQNITAFGQNAVNQFTSLSAATGNANMAMVLMQPELQALWEHQQKFGAFADEATQALIDQAETAGLVGPEMRDPQQQLLDVMREIRDTLYTIAGIEIEDKTFNVTADVDWDIPDFPTRGPEDAPQMAAGGWVSARPGGTLVNVGEGGEDELITPASKVGRGGVTVNLYADVMVGEEEYIKTRVTQGVLEAIRLNIGSARTRADAALELA